MMQLYNTILYQPLFNATVFLYNIIPGSDFGLAIITLTVLIRIVMFPLTLKTTKSQRALTKINPQIKLIKEKFKKDTQSQSAAIMALYKENDQTYVLQQEVDDGVISFRLIVPPYKDEYFNPRDSWNGVVYGPDGRMETNRNVKGLPKRIDMDKTVELFLKQVIEKDFSKPVLVRA